MNIINFNEHQARRLVDSLFNANAARHGEVCEWPVLGGHYVSGVDPIEAMKEKVVQAIRARAWFAVNGPTDAPPLPLSYDEREDLKQGRGLLSYLVGLFARSLDGRNYDVKEHPPFADYVSGVLWEAERVGGDIGCLPSYPDELAELTKHYPPTMLPGIGPGFCWEPPAQHAETMARYRCALARSRAAA